jgi:8-oxo-dGTP pyrophosphatase MutT (NUDIX family)
MTPDLAILKGGTLREALRQHLSDRPPRRLPLTSTKAAAVLLPLFERGGEVHVWLVRRPTSMRSHAGQVAFPGGKSDAADDSLRATALRETHEELGIDPARVDVLGALDEVHTYVSGFTISPWVGWLAPETAVVPSASEVARAFAAPLRAFFEPPSGTAPFVGWTIEGELVWGATAALLRGFVAIVGELAGAGAGAQ